MSPSIWAVCSAGPREGYKLSQSFLYTLTRGILFSVPQGFPPPRVEVIASDDYTAKRTTRRTRRFVFFNDTAVSVLLLEMIANFVQPDYMRRKVAIIKNLA